MFDDPGFVAKHLGWRAIELAHEQLNLSELSKFMV
jgi:hypothetical protein